MSATGQHLALVELVPSGVLATGTMTVLKEPEAADIDHDKAPFRFNLDSFNILHAVALSQLAHIQDKIKLLYCQINSLPNTYAVVLGFHVDLQGSS